MTEFKMFPTNKNLRHLNFENSNLFRISIFGFRIFGFNMSVAISIEDLTFTYQGAERAALQNIHKKLEPRIQKECPFAVKPQTNAPVTWVKPEVVCEVELSGWTDDGVMRQPVFLRLREDKTAHEVEREKPLRSPTVL